MLQVAAPPDPILRGPPIRWAGQLTQRRGWLRRHTPPRLSLPLRRRKVRLSPFPPDGENCARFLAPPLQRKPTPLGFALGAAFGGLLDGKFRMVRFHNCAWVCRTNAPGPFSP